MLFVTDSVKSEELNAINNFFNEFEAADLNINDEVKFSYADKYVSSLVSSQYQKSVKDIENTKTSNKIVRRKNLQQVMQESFFYGANRFGNNFIA